VVNLNIYNGSFSRINHNVEILCGGSSLSGVQFHDSQIDGMSNWYTTAAAYHYDGFFVQGPNPCSGIYEYNNWYKGDWSPSGGTGAIFLDGSAISGFYGFNDVFTETPTAANGDLVLGSNGTVFLYNETVLCAANASIGGFAQGLGVAQTVDVRNNVETGCSTMQGDQFGTAITAMDYNAYANLLAGGNQAFYWAFSASSGSGLAAQFASWQGIVQAVTAGSEAHSLTAASAGLNANGVPQSGSFVIGAGANLTSLCSGILTALCSTTSAGNTVMPVARPATGAWTIGAYGYGPPPPPAPTPAPPTNLIMIGKTTTQPPGSPANVTLDPTSTATTYIFDFGIPSGLPGAVGLQGIQGIQGVAGTNGTNGAPGKNGTNGTNGTNGKTPTKMTCTCTGNTSKMTCTCTVTASS
jgi:hypothetical protein